jgi:hypothetical protein
MLFSKGYLQLTRRRGRLKIASSDGERWSFRALFDIFGTDVETELITRFSEDLRALFGRLSGQNVRLGAARRVLQPGV